MPIEQVREGTPVLSQPEDGGTQNHLPAIKTTFHEARELWAVRIRVVGAEYLTTLFAATDQPFWVETHLDDGKHWLATQCLKPGFIVQLGNGDKAHVHMAGLIRHTQYEEYGFAEDPTKTLRVPGVVVGLRSEELAVANDDIAVEIWNRYTNKSLPLGDAYKAVVYGFELEDFDTYYVGDTGVLVHTNSGRAANRPAARSERI